MFDWRSAFQDLEAKRNKDDLSEQVLPPVPNLSEIEQTGVVVVSFSEDMYIVPDLAMITNGTVPVNGEI